MAFIVVVYDIFYNSKLSFTVVLFFIYFFLQTATCPIYFASGTILEEGSFFLYQKSSPWRPRVDVM